MRTLSRIPRDESSWVKAGDGRGEGVCVQGRDTVGRQQNGVRCSQWPPGRGARRDGRTDGKWPHMPWEELGFVLAAKGVVGSDYFDSFLSKKSSGGQA